MKQIIALMLIYFSTTFVINFFGRSEIPNRIEIEIKPELKDPVQDKLVFDYDSLFLSEFSRIGSPGAAVVIVRDGKVIFTKGYGVKEAGTTDSVDVHTVFRVGSLSKGFASTLAGISVSEGLLSFEDRVKNHVPWFSLRSRKQADRITVRHLLSHTTGLPYHTYTDLIEKGYTLEKIVKYFPNVRLIAREGAVYAYQNAAFGIIEEVLQSATGKTYNELIHEKIFGPLNMTDASVTYEEMVNNPDKALPHDLIGRRRYWKKRSITHKYYNVPSAGGVNASISDMGNWLLALLGNHPEVISPAVLDSIFQPVVSTTSRIKYSGSWPQLNKSSYAMGWRIFECDGGNTVVYHGGFVNDFKAEIALDRRNNTGICVLYNGANAFGSKAVARYIEMFHQRFEPKPLQQEELTEKAANTGGTASAVIRRS